MTQYRVHGANVETGEERMIVVAAESEQAAMKQARGRGLLASRVERADALPMPGYSAPSVPPHRGRSPGYLGLQIGGAMLVAMGILQVIAGGLWAAVGMMGAGAGQGAGFASLIMAVYTVAAGVLCIALGSACAALRDIARNSWT